MTHRAQQVSHGGPGGHWPGDGECITIDQYSDWPDDTFSIRHLWHHLKVPFTMAFQLNKIRACYPGFYQLPELVSPAPGDGAAVVAAHVAPHHVRLVIDDEDTNIFLQ